MKSKYYAVFHTVQHIMFSPNALQVLFNGASILTLLMDAQMRVSAIRATVNTLKKLC